MGEVQKKVSHNSPKWKCNIWGLEKLRGPYFVFVCFFVGWVEWSVYKWTSWDSPGHSFLSPSGSQELNLAFSALVARVFLPTEPYHPPPPLFYFRPPSLGSSPWHPSTQKAETGGSKIWVHPELCSEFEVILSHIYIILSQIYIFASCLRYCSIIMKRHHEQSNL